MIFRVLFLLLAAFAVQRALTGSVAHPAVVLTLAGVTALVAVLPWREADR